MIEKILTSSLSLEEKSRLLRLLQTQEKCKTFISQRPTKSDADKFCEAEGLWPLWEKLYFPEAKFISNYGIWRMFNALDVIQYIGIYADYDISSALKKAA